MTTVTRPARTLTRLFVALLLPASVARAQLVRGAVLEESSGQPIAGVLVTLQRVVAGAGSDSVQVITSVLSAEDGSFAIRALVAGQYQLLAKRIGVQRHVSATFPLSLGETRRMDIRLSTVALALPEVTVSGLCVTRRDQLARVSSLWDEARTALLATQVSLRDSLVQSSMTRYISERDARTLRVRQEWRASMQVALERPFSSLSADSLSRMGYWRVIPGDSVEFHGPDAEVLASNAFLRDHCFSLAASRRDRPGLVGLSFAPARERRLPDIRGEIWIDARTFELDFVEFRYTQLSASGGSMANAPDGEVHFARLPTGAWIVQQWFIRMTQNSESRMSVGAVVEERVRPFSSLEPRIREEGGHTQAAAPAPHGRPATLVGMYRDSAGRPMAGAEVRLAGTRHVTTTDRAGGFRFDSLPAGTVHVIAQNDGYDAFDMVAAQLPVTLQEGGTSRITLRARTARDIVADVCDGRAPIGDRATLRLALRDSASGAPFTGIRFLVTWAEDVPPPESRVVERRIDRATSSRGIVVFCALPSGVPLEVSIVAGTERRHTLLLTLARREVASRVVLGKTTQ